MTITQRYCLFGLCLIALVMPVNTSGAYIDIHVPLDDESQEIITRGVLNKQIIIVPQLNKLNFGLGRYEGVSFYFKKMLYLPDLAVEMEIEKEWSELLYDYEPLMDGSARQADLSNLGKRILRNWPVALLGYDYSFHLIKSSKMNAIAIPTGKIVVSTTLLEALENEEEREALLSLAIAHIEMHHSLRQYQLQLSASQNSDAMKSLVKAGDTREEPIVEQFMFVRGKLEY